VSYRTITRWKRDYLAGGFEALVPAPRQASPRTPGEVLELGRPPAACPCQSLWFSAFRRCGVRLNVVVNSPAAVHRGLCGHK
jgi:hypothetical protein